MKIEITKHISIEEQSQIVNIWNAVYPASVSFESMNVFKEFIDNITEKNHFIWRDGGQSVGGWLMTFTRDNVRNFVLLVAENNQGRGVGKMLIEEMKKVENEVTGLVVESDNYVRKNGSIYRSPIDFYKKLGFIVTDERVFKHGINTVKVAYSRKNSV